MDHAERRELQHLRAAGACLAMVGAAASSRATGGLQKESARGHVLAQVQSRSSLRELAARTSRSTRHYAGAARGVVWHTCQRDQPIRDRYALPDIAFDVCA